MTHAGRPVYRCSGCDTPLERGRLGRFRATAAAQVAISKTEGPVIESPWRVGDTLNGGLATVDAVGMNPIVIDPTDHERAKAHLREGTMRQARGRIRDFEMWESWGEALRPEQRKEFQVLKRLLAVLESDRDEAPPGE